MCLHLWMKKEAESYSVNNSYQETSIIVLLIEAEKRFMNVRKHRGEDCSLRL